MKYALVWLMAAVALGAASGCGSNAVYPVKGKITFEGKPLKGGGAITFQPTGNQAGKAAGGTIKEDGSYELMTYKAGDGSMAGEFRVVIHQSTEREPDATKDGERTGKSIAVVGKDDRIPLLYGDPAQSPLTTKVEKGPNELNFDLKRDVGPPPIQGAMRGIPSRDNFANLNRERFLVQPD
jgi:hypothetical protein